MPKILVVDDAKFSRERVTKMLHADSYEVLEAGNGVEAIETYKTCGADVVLMDVTMPEMDGLTALKHIRAFDPQARVVMLTTLGQESIALEAVRSGAVDFVIKPIDRDRVLIAIKKILA
jgi:two-component system, chemotaxis family, chemotaxis protein CheY